MKKLILGPTFRIAVADSPDVVADRLGVWLEDSACPVGGLREGRHLQMRIKKPERHRWSPWLTLDVYARCEDGEECRECGGDDAKKESSACDVLGRFNPSPAIWTAYMLVSLVLITIGTGAAMWGMAQVVMKNPPTALWVIPVCLLVLGVMWGVSAVGQRIAGDQMRAVEEVVRGIVGDSAGD